MNSIRENLEGVLVRQEEQLRSIQAWHRSSCRSCLHLSVLRNLHRILIAPLIEVLQVEELAENQHMAGADSIAVQEHMVEVDNIEVGIVGLVLSLDFPFSCPPLEDRQSGV